MPGRYHPDPLSLSHGRTMGRWTYEYLSHYGDSDSKRYHHIEKKSNVFPRKTRKKKAGEDEFVGFREKRIGTIPSYFLRAFASFTTSRTGYFASVSGTVYIVPVSVSGESVSSKPSGRATAIASPSFLP